MVCLCVIPAKRGTAQVDENQPGAWYMYFFSSSFGQGPWGVQGDVQYRNFDMGGDLEQLLVRGGLTYRLDRLNALLTLGYGNITTGTFGGSSDTTHEDRLYQELLLPHRIGERFLFRHRLRLEQRWVDDQDFRTRFRYAMFLDVPLNQTSLSAGAVYLALYDEIFINGERDIGSGRSVDSYDRNRAYAALGYSLTDSLRVQAGYMHQHSKNVKKGQFQLSLHHSF